MLKVFLAALTPAVTDAAELTITLPRPRDPDADISDEELEYVWGGYGPDSKEWLGALLVRRQTVRELVWCGDPPAVVATRLGHPRQAEMSWPDSYLKSFRRS